MRLVKRYRHAVVLPLCSLILVLIGGCFHPQPSETPWDTLKSKPQSQQKMRVIPSDCGIRHTYPLKKGFEMWYCDIFCDDGTIIMVYFKIGSLFKGLTPRAVACIHLYREGAEPVIVQMESDDFSAGADDCNVTIGPHRFWGTFPDYSLHIDFAEVRLDLHITATIRGYKLTDNSVRFGSGENPLYNEWIVFIPRGSASGTLTISNTERPVSGMVYMDHWLGNSPLNKTYATCHWGKVYTEDFSMIFLIARATEKYGQRELGFFKLFEGDQLIAATDAISLQVDQTAESSITEREYPLEFTLNVADPAENISGSLHCNLVSVLAAVNHVKTQLGRWSALLYHPATLVFGKPYSYGLLSDCQADFLIDGKEKSFRGMMFHEIDNND